MPYLRGDAAMFDEILSEVDPEELPPDFASKRPGEQFEYESAAARFEPEKLGAIARLTLDALRGIGVTRFRVRYDGGYDEGFAHADSVYFGPDPRHLHVAVDRLATPEFVERFRTTCAQEKGGTFTYIREMLKDAPARKIAEHALDELAHELASTLLGDGYGTGEYQLYGELVADFSSGEISDDPSATKPTGMS
jgi:hypothetical protein